MGIPFGSSSSKNVSKMMQTASINISTGVDQGSTTSASSSNMVSQVCNNVRAVSSVDGGWTAKVKSIEELMNEAAGKAEPEPKEPPRVKSIEELMNEASGDE